DAMATPTLRKDRVRLVVFVKRKAGMSFEDWSNYFLKTHGPIFLNTQIAKQNLIRYEQLHVNQAAKQLFEAAGYKVPEFDGVVVFEAESYEKIVATITSEEWFREVIARRTLLDKGQKAAPALKFQEWRTPAVCSDDEAGRVIAEDLAKLWFDGTPQNL
ncbi:hypothetical protein MPER_04860, partial [Moniliophthora perniciosa FA553]